MGTVPLGIFGGSFDPPHLGHRALVEAARRLLGLECIRIVPVGAAVHRCLSGCADRQRRLTWAERTFADLPGVRVVDWEIRSDHPVPTVETLRRLAAEAPEYAPVLLLGGDAYAGMADWIGYPEHARLCDVAVFRRVGHPLRILPEWRRVDVEAWRASAGAGRVIPVECDLPDVSATEVRRLASAGRSLEGLVPEAIRADVEAAYRKAGEETAS